jgi:hypothetical protein
MSFELPEVHPWEEILKPWVHSELAAFEIHRFLCDNPAVQSRLISQCPIFSNPWQRAHIPDEIH